MHECATSPLRKINPQIVEKHVVSRQGTIAGPSLHEVPHTGVIGENDPNQDNFQLLGLLGFGYHGFTRRFFLEKTVISLGLSRHHSCM